MSEEQKKSSLPPQPFFIRGEEVSKSKSLTTFNLYTTNCPPSITFFEDRFWLSVIVYVDEQIVDLRLPISARECAHLTSQAAKAMACFLAYNESAAMRAAMVKT